MCSSDLVALRVLRLLWRRGAVSTHPRIVKQPGSASPPSLSVIAKAEGLSKQTIFRLKQDPQAALAALDAWGI